MRKQKPGLVLVDKKWSKPKPGECTFWQRQKHAPWIGPEGKMDYATFVLACPRCGPPVELNDKHTVVNVAGKPIWIIGIINCPEETCCAGYYCREGYFEFVVKKRPREVGVWTVVPVDNASGPNPIWLPDCR